MNTFFQREPKNWTRTPLKFLIESSKIGAWGNDAGQDQVDSVCLRVSDFDWQRLGLNFSQPTIRSFRADQIRRLALVHGDIVLEKSGGGEKTPVGRVVMYSGAELAVTSNFVARVRPATSVFPKFLLFTLAAQYMSGFSIQFVKQNTGIQNLDDSALFRSSVWVPNMDTQKSIADFLDRETARIDQLIEKKQRLVDLLTERSLSAIEQAIESEARLSKLGHHINILPGYAFASSNFSNNDEDIRLLRGANVSPGRIKWNDVVYWPKNAVLGMERFILKEGDIVFGMDRPWISSGVRIAELTAVDVPSLLLQRVCKIIPLKSLSKEFLKLLLSSQKFLGYFEPELTGVSVPHISGDQIAAFKFSYFPVSEQKERAVNCRKILNANKDIVSKAERTIVLLQEFRSALITAAVTGQIDVSTWGKKGETERRMDHIEEQMT